MKRYRPVSLKSVKTYSLAGRKSKVDLSSFAGLHEKGGAFASFIDKLPDFYAAADFRSVVSAIVTARREGRPVILGMGAHPVKLGLSPIIIDLMRRGVITAVATNGACVIHDFEIAMAGHTSEDVAKELCTGAFGMSKDTGRGLNMAVNKGVKKGLGIGSSVGSYISGSRFPHKDMSILCQAYKMNIPVTVHVAIGTDIIHMHPEADGAAIGRGSMQDFRLFASIVSDLEGGVYLNLGSAVLLPEVFLKALNLARNLGSKADNITTVNMDFIQHYRPKENVLRRPTMVCGRNYALTGHHEIMFPLLAAAVIEEMP
jgi:deoxyhypusine synthase